MASPTPAPTPGAAPAPSDPAAAALAGALPALPSSTTSGSMYGLGQWGGQTIHPGNLPFVVGPADPTTSTTITGDDVVQGFAHATPAQIAQVQQALLLGGFYTDSNYTPAWGVARPEDITAFGKAVIAAAQSGATSNDTTNPTTTVAQYLLQAAQIGTDQGIASAQAKRQVVQISVPSAADLAAGADDAFRKTLGRKATQEEQRAFAAAYQHMYTAAMTNAARQAADPTAGQQPPDHADPTALPPAAPLDPTGAEPREGRSSRIDPLAAHTNDPAYTAPDPTFGQILGDMTPSPNDPSQNLSPIFAVSEQPPDPSVAAANYARSTHPNEAAATDTANAFNVFMQILSGNFAGGG